jgi:hypothetical protein
MELMRVRQGYRRSIERRVRFLIEEFVGREDVINEFEEIEPDLIVVEGDDGNHAPAVD